MSKLSIDEIIKEDAIVKAMATDLIGGFKEIIFPAKILKELIEVGVAYDGSSFHGINAINKSDAILQGVKETLIKCHESIVDIEKPEYWIICNILDTNTMKPHENCSRSRLIKMQEKLKKIWHNGNLFTGAEPEAFFIENHKNIGNREELNSNYFNSKDPKTIITTEIQDILSTMGYEIERAHAERADDQFEINWEFDKAERTADRIQMYKLICHKVAVNYDLDVTFLPKPYPNRNGSGMHCHISVGDGNENFFYDDKKSDENYFSDKALNFLNGILDNARPLAAIANSTEVSYARLVPGCEAPCVIAMGQCNRSAACRIPAIANKTTFKKAIRAEFRFPDPLANPYLLKAGFIAAGIDGLERKLKFSGFLNENLYQYGIKEIFAKGYKLLPRNLWEAYSEFINSQVLKENLGEVMHESYADLILDEIDSCQKYANVESVKRHYFA